MNIFGSRDTVDGKARSALGDLPEDPSPYEIFQTVDQKAGDTVDPDEVVQRLRDLDDGVDAKLAAVEGQDVDQKDMREAAGTIAERTDMSQAGAMRLLSAVVDSIEQMDPSEFTQDFGDVVDEYYRGDGDGGDVDQAADTDQPDDSDMGTESDSTPNPNSGTDTDTDTDTANAGADAGAGAGGDVDQKQDDGDGGDGDDGGPLEMLNDAARETVEEFAELSGKDPEECVQEVLGGGGTAEQTAVDTAAGDHDRDAGQPGDTDQMKGYDQKLDEQELNERVAAAVTSDEVLDEMAGAVAQKMADDDEFADNLVETVDKKGDFVTTDDTVVTAPSNDSETVGDAGAITGGDGE
ncbi:hypothetical protein [Natrarchaeobius oligotrophus]|uniref:Uncharacterized protein n=1 Tax=Natrarchaeobius chitinivorans TaxID=1679083 RepID=A0A3N6LU33_NATCH|nr:hypothetical protein [Natrarchaeobius chitinivorans]RQG93738.1 hypothetical protein EA472_22655 [Natrarchaeobius chitinivorans]